MHLLPKTELLNGETFYSLAEAKTVINSWRVDYNETRPHSSLGNLTLSDFAAQLKETRKVA